MKLTQKQEIFTLNLLKGMTQREAWIQAGYSSKYPVAFIDSHACRLANKDKIKERLNELRAEAAQGAVMTLQEILERHSEIARARLGDFIDTDGELVKIDKDSLNSAALQELKTTQFTGGKDGRASSKTTTIELRDPVRSMQEIAKLQGHYPKEDTNITYNDIKVLIVREQPREALESKPSHEIEGNSKE